jgi:transmembrane sensor
MGKAELSESLPRVSLRWTEERSARVRAAIERRAKRRQALRRAGAAGIVLLGVLLAALQLAQRRTAPAHAQALEATAASSVAAGPGAPSTEALDRTDVPTPLDPESVIVPEPDGNGRAYRVQRGGARFQVTHDEARPFHVQVGSAVIEDVGTVFTVRRLSPALAEVAVDEGRVRVATTDGSFEVGTGERRTFGTEDPATEPERRRARAVAPWRPLAESGRYGEAYASMKAAGRAGVRDEAGELLLAADVARLSGHPADAVPFLEQLLKTRASDPRAGLAAFTLGRVELDDLGRPAEAAAAFARAREAGGPLAEDALAREIEALSRSGDVARARTLALEYEKLYPEGRRARAVEKFGGLE